jgi:hypothetical protein
MEILKKMKKKYTQHGKEEKEEGDILKQTSK